MASIPCIFASLTLNESITHVLLSTRLLRPRLRRLLSWFQADGDFQVPGARLAAGATSEMFRAFCLQACNRIQICGYGLGWLLLVYPCPTSISSLFGFAGMKHDMPTYAWVYFCLTNRYKYIHCFY